MSLNEVLSRFRSVSVRIDMTKDFPVTISKECHKEYQLSKLSKKAIPTITLAELITAEDFTELTFQAEEIFERKEGSLRLSCRLVPDDCPCLICCELHCEKKLGKTVCYFYGVIMLIGELGDSKHTDPLLRAFSQKVSANVTPKDTAGILEIVGKEQIALMQVPLMNIYGVRSAVFTEEGELICTHDLDEKQLDVSVFRYKREIPIKINYIVFALWIVASDNEADLENCAQTHEILVQTLAKAINCSILLYNEMFNTERANRLLSETVTQQILLNDIYGKVFNEHNTRDTFRAIVDMTGEFLKLDRITICEYLHTAKKCRTDYEWVSPKARCKQPAKAEFAYSEYPDLIEELKYYETYFTNDAQHDVLGVNFSSYVASNLRGDAAPKYGMVIYLIDHPSRVLSPAEKRLLRTVSQIIAAVIIKCKDNEKLEELNTSLVERAFYDPKLKIKNRISLENDLKSELHEFERSGAIVLFKIPMLEEFMSFENIGEIGGVQEGNNGTETDIDTELYCTVLEKICEYEEISVKPYRFSDEVFALLLHGATPQEAQRFCQTLKDRFKNTWSVRGNEYYFEFTAGIAPYPEAGKSVHDVLRAGTAALKKAKEFGGNHFAFFSETFEDLERENYACMRVLRTAVKNDMEGLTVKYTPVYESAEGNKHNLIGAEAIIALKSADGGDTVELSEIPSRVIMRAAEKMGLDTAIGYWLIKQACEFCKEARSRSSGDLRVSISATARSLSTGSIISASKKALTETGLAPAALVLSFSERIITMNYDKFISTLKELKQAGITVMIDNIGSYYSLASMLRHSVISGAAADITVLTGKIDEFDEAYIKSIIELAKSREVKFGVKSIENDEQLKVMSGADADWYQREHREGALNEEAFFGLL
ncbi:MAG: GGDEF domain-containing phosphodiesterase [Oscillospiraceae bacterium]|nr:GGDEF domain-containing phosphodiesterase [Oscillospiraceae bacterium]